MKEIDLLGHFNLRISYRTMHAPTEEDSIAIWKWSHATNVKSGVGRMASFCFCFICLVGCAPTLSTTTALSVSLCLCLRLCLSVCFCLCLSVSPISIANRGKWYNDIKAF